jgi:uroporphyrinogen-III synthase
VTAYQTIRPDAANFLIGPFDAITFVSPSSVTHFCELVERPVEFIGGALVGCIGPVTAQTAYELGLPVDIVADLHTVEGLIAGLIQAYQKRTIVL